MDMKSGDIVDKYTILRMKVREQPTNKSLMTTCSEYGAATDQICSVGDPDLIDLVEINAKIWILESMLSMLRTVPDLSILGDIAMKITALNKVRQASIARINLKGELNESCKAQKDEDGTDKGK